MLRILAKVLIRTLLLFLLLIGLVFLIATIVPVKQTIIETAKSEETKTYLNSCEGEIHIVDRDKLGNQLWQPVIETQEGEEYINKELYCIEPGTLLVLGEDNSIEGTYHTKEDIERLISLCTTQEGKCGCAPNVEYYLAHSDTYYECTGNHLRETSSFVDRNGTYHENLYEIGFIASFLQENQSRGEWSVTKQQAIWMSVISQTDYNKWNSYQQELGEDLTEWADKYKRFMTKIAEPDSNGETGIKPVSQTNESQVKLDMDSKEKLYKLGPFKMSWVDGKNVDGIQSWYSYGGISDMYLLDDQNNKIDIINFVINGQIIPVDNVQKWKTFFSIYNPNTGRDAINKIDWAAYQKQCPTPGQEFYVEFKYTGELTGAVKLHTDFQWLKCEAEVCIRDGYTYYVDQNERHYYHFCHSNHDCGRMYYG